MTSNPPDSPFQQPERPWQYSMKTLFVVTLVVAVALAILVSMPSVVAVPALICLAIAIPAMLTMVAMCGSRYERTFAIGALFPTCTLLYTTTWLFVPLLIEAPGRGLDSLAGWLDFVDKAAMPYRVYSASAWILAIAIGSIAVLVRRHLEARSGGAESDA